MPYNSANALDVGGIDEAATRLGRKLLASATPERKPAAAQRMRRPAATMAWPHSRVVIRGLCVAVLALAMRVNGESFVSGAVELSVSPSAVEIAGAPGQVVTRSIELHNSGRVAVRVLAYAWDLWHDGLRQLYAPPGSSPRSIAGWLVITPREALLAPGDSRRVEVAARIPGDARGGQYAVVFFEMTPLADGPITDGAGVPGDGTRR